MELEQIMPIQLCFDNDDSGLGMDLEEYDSQQQTENFEFSSLTRQSFFHVDNDASNNDVQTLFEESDSDSSSKFPVKRQREEQIETDSVLKRHKCTAGPKKLKKSLSFGDNPFIDTDNVCRTVDRVLEQDDVIADGTAYYKLPTVKGKHADLKSITPETMKDILTGRYNGMISSFRVVDCRYPFEYDGGHIQGAVNLHTKDMILDFLKKEAPGRPEILIFHCEFSSERGPKLCRFLRNIDRQMNGERYPALYFPEIYILHGGYKDFYESCEELCYPRNYIPMLHKDYTVQVRHFRSKSKSWSAGDKRRSPQRLF